MINDIDNKSTTLEEELKHCRTKYSNIIFRNHELTNQLDRLLHKIQYYNSRSCLYRLIHKLKI